MIARTDAPQSVFAIARDLTWQGHTLRGALRIALTIADSDAPLRESAQTLLSRYRGESQSMVKGAISNEQ